MSSIYAKIAPPGMESAVFGELTLSISRGKNIGSFDDTRELPNDIQSFLHTAYTVGIANFCGMVSNLLGSGVIRWSGMKTVGDNCDFEALPYLIVIFQIIVPLAVGIPAIFLIPNVLQTEHLIDWKNEGWYAVSNDDEIIPGPVVNEGDDDDKDPRLEPHYLL